MKISEVLIEECISKVYFGYAAKSEVYANLSLDITKLYAIGFGIPKFIYLMVLKG